MHEKIKVSALGAVGKLRHALGDKGSKVFRHFSYEKKKL